MTHPLIEAADAVTTELNGVVRVWAEEFTAVRLWRAVFTREQLATMRCSVIGTELASERLTRSSYDDGAVVLIDVQKLLTDVADVDEFDALVEWTGRVYEHFRAGQAVVIDADVPQNGNMQLENGWAVTEVTYEQDEPWVWEALYELGLYQGAVRLVVKKVR